MVDNPLLAVWNGPFSAPPFDRIRSEHFLPAFDVLVPEARAELDAIAAAPAPASFANTLVALERAGERLARVRRVFWALSSAQSDDAMRTIEGEVSDRLTRHSLATTHDPRLFARVAEVWVSRDALDPEEKRLTEESYNGFVAGGALLSGEAKKRFSAIELRLGELSVRFGQNVLAATGDWSLILDEADCDGLPESVRAAAARRAELAGEQGYRFTLDRGEVEDFLGFSTRRDLRERVWRAFVERCDGGARDNWLILNEMVALRQERAMLLGAMSHAEDALKDSMARTPEAARGLLERVWAPAVRKARLEREELSALAGFPIEAWDWRFYAERVRREHFSLDGAAVKAHLTLDAVRDAAFGCAERLYGLVFTRRTDVPVYHPDVRVYAVANTNGQPVGLIYTDYAARPEKHGGAWMGSLRVQERLDGAALPIVYCVANFSKAPPPEQTRLSLDEARTLFHEFGHALHALLSDVTYPSLAGTAVARDFVEFPSKFMEHWIVAGDVLAGFGVPVDLIAAIGRADRFGQGFSTVELLGSAIVDLAIHSRHERTPDVRAIQEATLARIGMPPEIGMRHRLPQFTHIFDGGYAAAYYSYVWSEVLDADAFAAFEAVGDLFQPDLARAFRREVLAEGNARDPAESFRAFRGRDADERYFLESRGLVEA